MDKVSIVLPTYNGSKYLRESIDSCLTQTHTNLELLVVDGGSTDATLEILRTYSDPRIKVLHQPANSGRLPGALNIGFANATGDYLTWTQDDDLFEAHALGTLLQFLQRDTNVGFAYSHFWVIDGNGEKVGTSESDNNVRSIEHLSEDNCVGHSFLYRREVYENIGNYDTTYFMAEDYEYWIRVSLHYRMKLYHELLYRHRMHAGSLTGYNYGRYEALRVSARARRRWLGSSRKAYRQALARSYIYEMFDSHAQADQVTARRALVRALAYDPSWLRNRGVAALLLRLSLGPRQSESLLALARALGIR